MTLFGNIFGGAAPTPSGNVVSDNATTEEFRELARELIDEEIPLPNATWVQILDNEHEPNEPWDIEPPQEIKHSVKILFTVPGTQFDQYNRVMKDSDIGSGRVDGIMYHYFEFYPKLKDAIEFNGKRMNVIAVDPIQPMGQPIIHLLQFGL